MEDIEKLAKLGERRQNQIKRQNEHIKANYDRISCTIPKGMKENITSKGESINGLINKLLLEWLDNN